MKFDRYEVMHREDGSVFRLGHGSNSSSYKAVDLDLQTPVVLKVARQDVVEDDVARRRFLREARAAALLRHPNVAQIYRLGEVDGTCFYAREFVEGETLEAKVDRDGPMSPEEALNVGLQVAQALVAVKKACLVHRDIKPSNLMITADGCIKIIDFGLAKGHPGEGPELPAITLSGFVGTPDYASPEQLNEQELNVSSDMYSLGVTMWFLLTGRPPFRGATARVMAQHLQSPPPFEELSLLPPAVVSLLAHLLEKDPFCRPATPQHLIEELEQCQAALRGGASSLAPIPGSMMVSPIQELELTKMSAARVPVTRTPPQRFVFTEVLTGAAIAVLIYFVLSRPLPPMEPASAGLPIPAVASSPVQPAAASLP